MSRSTYCDCGRPGVRRDGSGWMCKRCYELNVLAGRELDAHIRMQKTNALDEASEESATARRLDYEAEYRRTHREVVRANSRRQTARRRAAAATGPAAEPFNPPFKLPASWQQDRDGE